MAGGDDTPLSVPEHGAISGYRDLVLIGSGGFSRVYRAYQERYDRTVAVKVLDVVDMDERAIERFERERALTGRLTGHPHIVTALDSGFTDAGHPYLTTEFYDRGSLTDRVAREGRLPVEAVLDIGVKIAGALETAHRSNVLHRDVKPQNVLVSRFGEPALGDFGISTISASRTASIRTGSFTPIHAPPEALEGQEMTERSDVYSLGSTLYYLLAGRAAFDRTGDEARAEGIMVVLRRIMADPLPPLDTDVPTSFRDVLEQAMAKDPDARHATAVNLGEALQGVQRRMGTIQAPMICPDPDDGEWTLTPSESSVRPADQKDGLEGLVQLRKAETERGGRIVVSFDQPLIVDLN